MTCYSSFAWPISIHCFPFIFAPSTELNPQWQVTLQFQQEGNIIWQGNRLWHITGKYLIPCQWLNCNCRYCMLKKNHKLWHVCGCYKLVEHVQRLCPHSSCTEFFSLFAACHPPSPPSPVNYLAVLPNKSPQEFIQIALYYFMLNFTWKYSVNEKNKGNTESHCWSNGLRDSTEKAIFTYSFLIFSSDQTTGSCCSDAAGGKGAEVKGERSYSGRKSSSS